MITWDWKPKIWNYTNLLTTSLDEEKLFCWKNPYNLPGSTLYEIFNYYIDAGMSDLSYSISPVFGGGLSSYYKNYDFLDPTTLCKFAGIQYAWPLNMSKLEDERRLLIDFISSFNQYNFTLYYTINEQTTNKDLKNILDPLLAAILKNEVVAALMFINKIDLCTLKLEIILFSTSTLSLNLSDYDANLFTPKRYKITEIPAAQRTHWYFLIYSQIMLNPRVLTNEIYFMPLLNGSAWWETLDIKEEFRNFYEDNIHYFNELFSYALTEGFANHMDWLAIDILYVHCKNERIVGEDTLFLIPHLLYHDVLEQWE